MNQAFLQDILKPHLSVVIFGDVKLDSTGLHFMNPEYELMSDDLESVRTARIVPFYEKTGGVTPNMQRRHCAPGARPAAGGDSRSAAGRYADAARADPRRAALEEAHFPPNEAKVDELNAFRTPRSGG